MGGAGARDVRPGKLGISELGLIREIREEFRDQGRSAREVALGIGDDCAILRPKSGVEVLVTTDMTIEGRHFRRDLHPPESVGHRCLARGLSDLAAMGANPMAAFLSLALPREMLDERAGRGWLTRFFAGMRALAERSDVRLAGGDTGESPNDGLMADIVLVGSAPVRRSLRRSGATVGDGLYVTGALGGAAAELERMLERGARRPVETSRGRAGAVVRRWAEMEVQRRHPQLFPEPRIQVGRELLQGGSATAAIDVSDGISTDLAHLVTESGIRKSGSERCGLAAEVMLDWLPVHVLARRDDGGTRLALHGGEDYELLFTAKKNARVPGKIAGVSVTRIGTIIRRRPGEPKVTVVDSAGARRELRPGGWEHFARNR